MTAPTHQQPPSITVYVPTDGDEDGDIYEIYFDGNYIDDVVQKTLPDPSYINAIINDPGSNDDKVKRLAEYLNTFDNLTKY